MGNSGLDRHLRAAKATSDIEGLGSQQLWSIQDGFLLNILYRLVRVIFSAYDMDMLSHNLGFSVDSSSVGVLFDSLCPALYISDRFLPADPPSYG